VTLTDSDLSDLSDLLAAMKAGEMTDTNRTSLEWVLQQLIEAEATAFIGAARHERSDTRMCNATGTASGCRRRRRATWSSAYPCSVRLVLPEPSGAAAPHRPGPVRGGHGGLGPRRQH